MQKSTVADIKGQFLEWNFNEIFDYPEFKKKQFKIINISIFRENWILLLLWHNDSYDIEIDKLRILT